MDTEANEVAQKWLDDIAFTAATWNLDAHMALVSREVAVRGIPGVPQVDYKGWRQRRHTEFSKKLLHSLTYRNLQLIDSSRGEISFRVHETMKGHKTPIILVDKNVTLRKEQDGVWRVVEELLHRIELRERLAQA